jgi:hypothetical protein
MVKSKISVHIYILLNVKSKINVHIYILLKVKNRICIMEYILRLYHVTCAVTFCPKKSGFVTL